MSSTRGTVGLVAALAVPAVILRGGVALGPEMTVAASVSRWCGVRLSAGVGGGGRRGRHLGQPCHRRTGADPGRRTKWACTTRAATCDSRSP